MIANVLSIAGSDPSGGAGIQADLKAISANGAYAMSALTALTAQNTQGVSGIHLVPPQFVQAQVKAVLDDVRVDAIKIGMIANSEIAAAVADALQDCTAPIVLDPVMIAKGGASLLQLDAVEALCSRLLPRATLLTPNLPEAACILGEEVAMDRTAMEQQGQALLARGPSAVLMKGGHLRGTDCPDCLVTKDNVVWFEGRRTPTRNTHGTGCTLSAALAAHLGQGRGMQEAVSAAKAYIATAIAHADELNVGSGHGPTNHFAGFKGLSS